MNPVLRHWLQGFGYTLLGIVLVGAANYLQANPVPGLDPVWVSLIVGLLLAIDKWLRQRREAGGGADSTPDSA